MGQPQDLTPYEVSALAAFAGTPGRYDVSDLEQLVSNPSPLARDVAIVLLQGPTALLNPDTTYRGQVQSAVEALQRWAEDGKRTARGKKSYAARKK